MSCDCERTDGWHLARCRALTGAVLDSKAGPNGFQLYRNREQVRS